MKELSHDERIRLGLEIKSRRGVFTQWKEIAADLEIPKKTCMELVNYLNRHEHSAGKWYSSMPKRLMQKVLANGLKSREELSELWRKHGRNMQHELINWGPQATNDMLEWMVKTM